MNEREAVFLLQTNPMEFLKKNAVVPSTTGPVGLNLFHMSCDTAAPIQRPGSVLGSLRRHSGKKFRIRPDSIFNGHPFFAVHLPVQLSNSEFTPLLLPASGPGIMITTQLTGCCIVMDRLGGNCRVTHLRPTGESGADLQQRLINDGRSVYGVADYTGNRATLVGVRINSRWCFYAQKQDRNSNILSVNLLS